MPWTVDDVDDFKKGLTPKEKERWVAVANDSLKRCLADGGTDCDKVAIMQANGVVEEARHETNGLGEKILEAVFDEKTSFRATLKGFLAAAKALVNTPGIPKKYADQISALNNTLSTSQWAKLAVDDSGGTQVAAESSRAIREALQSIARKQVRSRLREMSLGGVSVSEFETKLTAALTAKLGTGYEFRLLDIYENAVIYAAEGGMWGAPYTVGLNGAITIGEPIRVKRICRYVPEESGYEQDPLKPIGDRDDQGGELQLPGDWWKYSQDWGIEDRKVIGSTPTDTSSGRTSQEALREDGSIIEAATFTEDGALVEVGGQNG